MKNDKFIMPKEVISLDGQTTDALVASYEAKGYSQSTILKLLASQGLVRVKSDEEVSNEA